MYKVIKACTDLTDDHVYLTGDTYPRKGVKADEKRIAELSSTDNRRGEVLIEVVEKPKKKKGK